jgi:drug/metabolite transporter (DMT)-like permease
MWVAYYAALPHIPLSVAASAYYTLPIFITLFAALLNNETIGLKGWVAVFAGFCGVLLIVKPQADDFSAYALLPIVSAILYALAMIITRAKCRNENVLVLSFALNVAMIAVGVVGSLLLLLWDPAIAQTAQYQFLLGQWEPMGNSEWLTIGSLATAFIVGSIGAAIAYQVGPSSIVGTFDFTYVAFATVWGFVFFAEVPDTIAAIGMLLIVGSGVLATKKS